MAESFLTKWERVIKAQPLDLRSDETKFWHAQIDKAVAAERERCAKIAENPIFIQARDTEWDEGVNYAKKIIAAAIRADSSRQNQEQKS